MPIDPGTLQRIARGGPQIGNTLAGQIADRRRAAQQQQFEMQESLQELMMKQQKQQVDAQRKAVQSAKDKAEMQEMFRNMDLRDNLSAAERLVGMDPNRIRQRVQQNPEGRLATYLQSQNVDPTSPTLGEDIKGLRNSLYARSEGKLFEEEGLPERAAFFRPDSEVGQALNLDRPAEVQWEGQEIVPDRDDPNYNVTGFQYVGPQQEAGPPPQTRLEEEADKAVAEEWNQYIEEGEAAKENMRDMESIVASIDSGRFKTGFAGNLRSAIGSMMELAGMDPSSASDLIGDPNISNVIEGASSQIQTRLADDLGRVTNMSLSLVRNAVPGLLKNPRGNRLLADLLGRAAEYRVKRAEIAREYRQYGTETPEGKPSYNEALEKLDKEYRGISEEQENLIKEFANEGTWENPLPAPPISDLIERGKVYKNPQGVPYKALDKREDGSIVWEEQDG